MKKFDILASILIFVGAFNLGIVGIFEVNVLDEFIQNHTALRCIYSLVGIAAIYQLVYRKSVKYSAE